MNITVVRPFLAEALGWTLLHSLWQGLFIGVICWIVLRCVRYHSPRIKYFLSVGALITLVIWIAVTFWSTYQSLQSDTIVYEPLDIQLPALDHSEELSIGFWGSIKHQLYAFIESYARELAGVWLFGVLIFALRWMGSMYYTYQLRSIQTVPVLDHWQQKVNRLSAKMEIKRAVKLVESARAEVPMVIGHLKPIILFPLGMLSGLAPEQVEAILTHELAHVKRYDFIVNLFLSFLEVLLFYHPAYWWISSKINETREHCCDDIAVATCGNARLYAEALYHMEDQLQQTTLAMAIQGRKYHLLNRIQRICLGTRPSNRGETGKAGLALGLLLAIGAFAWFQVPDSVNASHTVFDTQRMEEKLKLWNMDVPPFIGGIAQGSSEVANEGMTEFEHLKEWREGEEQMEPRNLEDLYHLKESMQGLRIAEVFSSWGAIAFVDTPPQGFVMPPLPPMPPMPATPPMPPISGRLDMDSTSWKAYEEQMERFAEDMEKWGEKFGEEYEQKMEVWAEEYAQQYERMSEEYEQKMEVWAEEFERKYEKEMEKYEEEMEKYEEEMEKYEEEIEKGNERAMREQEKVILEQERALALADRELVTAHKEMEGELAMVQQKLILSQQLNEIELKKAQIGQARQIQEAKVAMEMQQREMKKQMRQNEVQVRQAQMMQKQQMLMAQNQLKAQQAQMQLNMAQAKAQMERQAREMEEIEMKLRAELIKDGLLDDANESLEVKIFGEYDNIKINGNKLNGNLKDKYSRLFQRWGFETGGRIQMTF